MVAVLRPFGEVVMLPFEVGHSNAELNALAEQLKSIEGETRVIKGNSKLTSRHFVFHSL